MKDCVANEPTRLTILAFVSLASSWPNSRFEGSEAGEFCQHILLCRASRPDLRPCSHLRHIIDARHRLCIIHKKRLHLCRLRGEIRHDRWYGIILHSASLSELNTRQVEPRLRGPLLYPSHADPQPLGNRLRGSRRRASAKGLSVPVL